MPKELLKLSQFHGGFNINNHAMDIRDEELQSAEGVSVNKIGQIILGPELYTSQINTQNVDPEGTPKGRGLITFGVDYTKFENAPGTASSIAGHEQIMVGCDDQTAQYWITDLNSNITVAANTSLLRHNAGSGNAGVLPVMYYANGALRCVDGALENDDNENLWRGHIDRIHFDEGPSAEQTAYNGWYQTEAEIKSPGRATYTESSNGTARFVLESGTAHTANISTTAGDVRIGWELATSSITNTLWEGTWDGAISFVYDDNQESLLHYIWGGDTTTGITVASNQKVKIWCTIEADDGNPINPRLSAIKFYGRKRGTVGVGTNSWFLLGNFSLKDGAYTTHAVTAGTVWEHDADHMHFCNTGDIEEPVLFTTYEYEAGHLAEDPTTGKPFTSLYARFKTAVIAKNYCFIGNVRMYDDSPAGYTWHEDWILKSPPFQFDKFPEINVLDISINDGESVVHIEEAGDRLLVFKQNTLYIVNIANTATNQEFLESSHKFKGVSNSGAVCKVETGVAWVNRFGVYLYDGEKITNLFEKEGSAVLDIWSDWYFKIGNTNNGNAINDCPLIGYMPQAKKLAVLTDADQDGDEMYFFHFPTLAWTKSQDNANFGLSAENKTNMVNHYGKNVGSSATATLSGELLWYETPSGSGELIGMRAVPRVAKQNLSKVTKEFDFGNLAQRKKIYRVYITHKNARSSKVYAFSRVRCRKATGGEGAGELSDYCVLGALVPDSGVANSFITQEFAMPATNEDSEAQSFSNVYSMEISLFSKPTSDGTEQDVPFTFAVSDMTISFRRKPIR